MTTRIALVRHGQSQANADGLFTGITDSPLTTGGREEARRAAHLLDETGFRPASILCSPLARATETACIMVSENQWTVPATGDDFEHDVDGGRGAAVLILSAMFLFWVILIVWTPELVHVPWFLWVLAAAVALCVAASLATARTVFLDVGMGMALVGFVGTAGWARLIERSAPHDTQEPRP